MSTANKVFLGLILVASLGLFVLTARALKTHQYWREQANQNEQELRAEVEAEPAAQDEVRELGVQLHEQLVDRGRVWFGCRPQQVNPQTGISVIVDSPDPHGIEVNKAVLWLFDETDVRGGGQYMGQFKATAVGGQDNREIILQPSVKFTQLEWQRLQQSLTSGASWRLYELMPVDEHDIFVEMAEQEKRDMLPDQSEEEYVLDNQLASLGDVRQRGLAGKVFSVNEKGEPIRVDENDTVVEKGGLELEVRPENEDEVGKYVRQLRDYEVIFRAGRRQRAELVDKRETTLRNKAYIDQAHANARQKWQYRQNERDKAEEDLAEYSNQRDLTKAHMEAVQQKLAQMQAAIDGIIKGNQAKAGEIARIQLEASQRINERVAQSGAGS